jgi:hypothetical protein
MFRNAIILAVVLVLGSSGLSTSVFAHGDGDGFRRNHFGAGFDGARREGHGEHRASGLFHGYGGNDVWGHQGAYYGPMIPTI